MEDNVQEACYLMNMMFTRTLNALQKMLITADLHQLSL